MDKDRQLSMTEAVTGQEFHRGECTRTHGPRGGITEQTERWRRTGMTKLWKTRPEDFRVPVRFGMRARDSWAITPDNVTEFHTPERCPLEDWEYRRVRTDGRVVEISKAGGGTLGRRYEGAWHVRITDQAGHLLLDDVDDLLVSGTPRAHSEVERAALQFLEAGD